MSVTEAPAARALLNEATRRYPGRAKAWDGILPSAAHHKRNPRSYHEKGDAVDLTVGGPINGEAEFARLRKQAINGDRRIVELIHNHKIATAKRGWTVRPYNGSNPHEHHIHVSIDHRYRDDTSTWWKRAISPDPDPAPAAVKPTPLPLRLPKEEPMQSLVWDKAKKQVWLVDVGAGTREAVAAVTLDVANPTSVRADAKAVAALSHFTVVRDPK